MARLLHWTRAFRGMNLSQAMAGSIVRQVVDLIDSVSCLDCNDDDFNDAVILLNELATRRGGPATEQGGAILTIVGQLKYCRR